MSQFRFESRADSQETLGVAEATSSSIMPESRRKLQLAAAMAFASATTSPAWAESCVRDQHSRVLLVPATPASSAIVQVTSGSSLVDENSALIGYKFLAPSDDVISWLVRSDRQNVNSFEPNYDASVAVRSPWANLLSDVARWGLLEDDWDGDGAIAPQAEAVHAARQLADKLRSAGIVVPEHYVTGDGELSFDWSDGERVASISFLHGGRLAAYYRPAAGLRLHTAEGTIQELMKDSLLLEGLRTFA